MNQLELKQAIKETLPKWEVTVDEASMINARLDDTKKLFCYIEEFDGVKDSMSGKFGNRRTRKEDIYFCTFCDMHEDGEKRVEIREKILRPAVVLVEKMLKKRYGVSEFPSDSYPRGFDANEVLIHIVVEYTEVIC